MIKKPKVYRINKKSLHKDESGSNFAKDYEFI